MSELIYLGIGLGGGALLTYEVLKNGEYSRGMENVLEEKDVDYRTPVSSKFSKNVSSEYRRAQEEYPEMVEDLIENTVEQSLESIAEESLQQDRELAVEELHSRDPVDITYIEDHMAAEGYGELN